MKTIKYIIHYDVNSDEGRSSNLAAGTKASYIMEVFNKIGFSVDVVSASLTSSKGNFHGSVTKINDNTKLIKMPALKWGSKLEKLTAYVWSRLALFFWLVHNVKRGESVLVYHSLDLMSAVKWAKRIKGFKMILEVEEIYSDVIKKSQKARENEIEFTGLADAYIFPSGLLNGLINTDNKPYLLIHGTYKVEPDRQTGFDDGKIHVVYAGTFDPRKGGSAAAAAAEFLPENYHIHIIGFGTDADIAEMKTVIEKTNEKSKAAVTYDGMFSGEEYIKFIQKCSIGLSTQNPDADFNATSFPSKILSYMANGLRVVSIRIPAIEQSAVGKNMYYYDKQTPEEIAKAIMSVDLNDGYDGRAKIKQMDIRFRKELEELLDNGKN